MIVTERITLTLPTTPDQQRWGLLEIPRNMYPDEWNQMMTVLEALRPGIVVPRPRPGRVGMLRPVARRNPREAVTEP